MKTFVFLKQVKFREACMHESAKQLLTAYEGPLDHERCLIDYKVHQLEIGEAPCRPIWHYDGHTDALTAPVVQHALFLNGGSLSQTKFFVNEPAPLSGTQRTIHLAASKLEQVSSTRALEFESWHHYTSHQLHKASAATTAGIRVLIRLKAHDQQHHHRISVPRSQADH